MANEYYVLQDGRKLGPFTQEILDSMQENGLLPKSAEIIGGDDVRLSPPGSPEPDSGLQIRGEWDASRHGWRFACPHCGQHYLMSPEDVPERVETCMSCGTRLRFCIGAVPSSERTAVPAPSVPLPDPELLGGNIICPHCWQHFSEYDVLYIASHPALYGDSVAGADAMTRFLPTVYNAAGQVLDAMGVPCSEIACPRCHLRLPAALLDGASSIFSIVGAPSSGKSYFLTALVHELRREVPQNCNVSFADADPQINQVLNHYEEVLFGAADRKQVAVLQKTHLTGPDFSDHITLNDMPLDLPRPFIFQMQSPNSGTPDPRDRSIVFYDNAGEHFQPGMDNVQNPATQHLVNSNAILFLFDPLNDAVMRSFCTDDPQLKNTAKVSNQTALFAEMVSRIRRHANLQTGQKCRIPLYILINKLDAWKSHFPDDLQMPEFFRPALYEPEMQFNTEPVYKASCILRRMLQRAVPSIIAQAESFFADVTILPCSSFGTAAVCGDDGGIGVVPEKIRPLWVTVPFFLTLWKAGLLSSVPVSADVPRLPDAQICGEQIRFREPGTGRVEYLPLNYAGRVISFDGRDYRLPDGPADV